LTAKTSLRAEDLALPPIWPGLRIGLFGGSFDPPHAGHLAVSHVALRALALDQIWWLVSPQNPLKPLAPSNDLARRIAAARRLAAHPAIRVSGVEAALGTSTTAATFDRLLPRLAGTRPVWMMGADSLAGFHRWESWTSIAARVPMAVFNRPGRMLSALASPAAHRLESARIPARNAAMLPFCAPPAWVFLPTPHIDLSSTRLRGESAVDQSKP